MHWLAANCSVALYMQAEETLISAGARWDSLYRHQQVFGACDDGGLAEGYSDAVVRLLAWRWGQIKNLAAISNSDPGFRRWVIKHIDATASAQDLQKIMRNSDKCIGDRDDSLCRLIRTAVAETISASNSNSVEHRLGAGRTQAGISSGNPTCRNFSGRSVSTQNEQSPDAKKIAHFSVGYFLLLVLEARTGIEPV